MREILFRGKRKDNGEWIEGFYFQKKNPFSEYGEPIRHFISDLPPFGAEVVPETVGQYTGLKDNNGKRIFEGDIVVLDDEVKKIFDASDGEVKYGWGGFYVHEFSTLCSLNTLAAHDGVFRGVVIGNIHDNPELLEDT